ncbi:MAG: recombinase family protein [Candidatus Poribacteria bacterium]|nr:recombinase family protein [Candidatus Poribacteria bacterium]MDP6751893.1 recombinase family protein [Candidatus Poribacteria bacterium]MDP6998680.1 recombinase family protein [Candidatus Poribacteria bacterium]
MPNISTRWAIVPKKGRPLSKSTVGYWFQNPYPYAGCYVWNARKKGKIQAEEDWIIVEDQHQAIISMEEAKSCRQQYHQRIKDGTRYRRITYPLSDCFIAIYVVISFNSKAARSTTTCITSVVLTIDDTMLVRISCT